MQYVSDRRMSLVGKSWGGKSEMTTLRDTIGWLCVEFASSVRCGICRNLGRVNRWNQQNWLYISGLYSRGGCHCSCPETKLDFFTSSFWDGVPVQITVISIYICGVAQEYFMGEYCARSEEITDTSSCMLPKDESSRFGLLQHDVPSNFTHVFCHELFFQKLQPRFSDYYQIRSIQVIVLRFCDWKLSARWINFMSNEPIYTWTMFFK
jgi:hypothetical protein